MSVTKHRIFSIPIVGDQTYSFETEELKTLDAFLSDPDIVYVNHSTTVFGIDKKKAANSYREVLLIISVVYKDLKETPYELKNVSRKTKKIVTKQVETGVVTPRPSHQTLFNPKKKTKDSK